MHLHPLKKYWLAAVPAFFVLLWSTGFVVAKFGLPYAPPLTFLILRFICVLIILTPLALILRAAWPVGRIWHVAVAGVLTTGLVASVAPADGRAATAVPHRVHPSPSHFTQGRVDNSWFPLKPGTRYVYRGTEEGAHIRDVLVSTYRTKVVDGVTCRVVFDRVWRNGRLNEGTHDFYAQTKRGTVWYFGEHTATLDRHGHVRSREGSFMSGRHGAEAFTPLSKVCQSSTGGMFFKSAATSSLALP